MIPSLMAALALSNKDRRSRFGSGLVIASVVLLLAGCARDNSQAHTHPTDVMSTVAVSDPAMNYSDPQAVCFGLTHALYTVDTSTDRAESDAYARIRPYVTAKLYGRNGGAGRGRNSVTWTRWVDHHVYTEVSVTPFAGDGIAPSSPGEQMAAATAEVTPVGAQGWRGNVLRHNVFCTLTHTGPTTWRVASYSSEDVVD